MSPLLAAWLGGVACYAGVLVTPTRSLPVWYVALLSLCWPVAIGLALAGEERHG